MPRICVVGRACRLPGADSVEAYWKQLRSGICSVTSVPPERFAQSWYFNPRRGEAGKAYTFSAGIIDDMWGFDPAVFAMTPREARQMDPQQRLALKLAWETFEDAGIPTSSLSGRNIGVYLGASSMDYSHRQFFDPAGTDSYLMTGNTLSLISNRISYIFDLAGPSLTIDTACSSSLVAMDYAMQDLRNGRVDGAIVGGVNALLSPFNFMGFCAASMLSPDGLCRPFDHRANGYVRAEGGVTMLLQRDDGTGIASLKNYGTIVASAMNSDGKTSGVALPSTDQQGMLLRRLYKDADVSPERLAFVEAHGTGTLVGDPAEAGAIGRELGTKRVNSLPIGSAKSNVGHLESASGIVGLLKAQLALEHGVLPSTLHVEKLNPHIPFEDLNLKVATDEIMLPASGALPLLAGVNNFGFGGTNVHVIIEAPKPWSPIENTPSADCSFSGHAPLYLMISAQCTHALKSLAQTYADRLSNEAAHGDNSKTHQAARQIANATAYHRSCLKERLVLWGDTPADLQAGFRHFADGENGKNIATGTAVARTAKVAFAFSGNGAQWDGMGHIAFAENTAFREAFQAVDAIYKKVGHVGLEDLLFADDLDEQLKSTELAQPLLFAIQVALARALMQGGLIADVVLGHSVGEVAAAHIAGALNLHQAVDVIRARSKYQELVHGLGLMAVVQLSADKAISLSDRHGLETVEIAAINTSRSVTVSGTTDDIRAFVQQAQAERVPAKILDIAYPFHSAQLEPIRAPLLDSLADLTPSETSVKLVSTVSGTVIDGRALDANYWWQNVRHPVLFHDAVVKATELGCQIFAEIGPRSVLRNYISDGTSEAKFETRVVATLERTDKQGNDPVQSAVAYAMVAGADFGREMIFGVREKRDAGLPLYPWQNKDYSLAPSPEALDVFDETKTTHPLLGMAVRTADYVWSCHLDTAVVPFLADHKVGSQSIMPGAAFVETALAAARSHLNADNIELRDVDFVQALELSGTACQEMWTRVDIEAGSIDISSRARLSNDDLTTNARTRYGVIPGHKIPELQAPRLRAKDDAPVVGEIYRLAEKFGLNYGATFQRVTACTEIGETVIEVELSKPADTDSPFMLHPIDFDACFHGLNIIYNRLVFGETKLAYVPIRIGLLRLYHTHMRVRTARIHLHSYNTRSTCASFELFADNGDLIAIADDMRFRASSLVHRLGLTQTAYHIAGSSHRLKCDARKAREGDHNNASAGELLREALNQSANSDDQMERIGDNQLLLDVAARRIAYDVLKTFADDNGVIDMSLSQDVEQSERSAQAVRTLTGLLNCLEDVEYAFFEDEQWRLLEECAFPSVQNIVETILAEDPAWSVECVMLLHAAQSLPSWIDGNTDQQRTDVSNVDADADKGDTRQISELYAPATLEHFYCASPAAQVQLNTVASFIKSYLGKRGPKKSCKILQLGCAGGNLTHELIKLVSDRGAHIVAADTDKSLVRRVAHLYNRTSRFDAVHISEQLKELEEFGSFDVIVSVNGLHQLDKVDNLFPALRSHLNDGAVAIVAEQQPHAFHDVVFGAATSWFEDTVDGQFVVGRQRSEDSWLNLLKAAGFETLSSGQEHNKLPGLVLLAEHRRNHTNDEQEELSPDNQHELDNAEPPARQLLVAGTQTLTDQKASSDEANAAAGLAAALCDDYGVHHVTRASTPLPNGKANGHSKTETIETTTQHTNLWLSSIHDHLTAKNAAQTDLVYFAGHVDETNATLALQDICSDLTMLLDAVDGKKLRLWIFCSGGARAIVEEGSVSPVQTGVWSFGRTALNEYADIDIRLVDIADDLSPYVAGQRLAALIQDPGDVCEVVLTANEYIELEVRRGAPSKLLIDDCPAGDESSAVLMLPQIGDLEQLQWSSQSRRAPQSDEVEIAVSATGLNYRDVMWSLGLLPEEALEDGFAGPTVGFECSGTIVSVGADVREFQAGDRVIAIAPACFASHVTVTSQVVAKLPETVGLADAATIPVAFLTASYALDYLAKLRSNEWVLIHGAAGGVGLAALQVARRAGARVIATAGTDEKRALLRTLGADHVLDSRSLQFADDVRTITGKGVDVVLNSLAGEAMERSIALMRPFGRFLELGKRDFYANTKVGLRAFRQNISYFGIDADQLLTHQPDVARDIFRNLINSFADGALSPLPYRQFNSEDVVDAFRLMQKSGHIGKIVVLAPPADCGQDATLREFTADADGAHVIIGGTGGFGLEMARWLADRGATAIYLTSRSGGSGETLESLREDLRNRGVELCTVACDATDKSALSKVLDDIRSKQQIKGVAHTAMVLDDGLIKDLTPERFTAVLAPKVEGAANLDTLTRQDDLDYFILFSSAAAMFGNPGQANYNAANGYLDGLARERSASGRKAISVAWGAISDAGVLTRQKDTAESLARHTGGVDFNAGDGLNLLANLLVRSDANQSCTNVTLAAMNWSLAGDMLKIVQTPSYKLIRRDIAAGGHQPGDKFDIQAAISGLDDFAASDVLAKYLAKEVAGIFRMPVEDISIKRPLADIGMDSLMGLELRMAAQRALGIDIPMVSIADGTTINDIAAQSLSRLHEKTSGEDRSLTAQTAMMLDKHVSEDIDDATLAQLEAQIGEKEANSRRVV